MKLLTDIQTNIGYYMTSLVEVMILNSAYEQPYMMRGVTNLSDNGLGVGLERTRDDDEADERQVFLDVFATQLTNLKTSPSTQHDCVLFSRFSADCLECILVPVCAVLTGMV